MDSTPINKTIRVEDIISRAKIQLRISNTTEHDNYMEIMAYEALNSLNALSQLVKKQCTLIFNDNRSTLPKDLVKFLALRINNVQNNQTGNDPIATQIFSQFQVAVYADTDFLRTQGFNTGIWGNNLFPFSNGFQINNGNIIFNFPVDVAEIIDAEIAYLGLNTDEDGKDIVYERYERAVASYICYMFSLSWAEKFNQYVINEYKTQWIFQRDKIKGQDIARDFQADKIQIGNTMRALLVSPRVNIIN